MKSNYEPLGKHIQLVDYRNSEEVTSTVLGISIDKEFMPVSYTHLTLPTIA